MGSKAILFLGGSVGGTVCANTLRERLEPDHRIVEVDKQSEYVFTPLFLWVMAGCWRGPSGSGQR